jgi:ribonuclease E
VVADATVSGQQSYVIDRGEQVHTLESAKALLTAQAASAPPPQIEESYDDEEPFDIEAEIETEETEGLSDETGAGDEASTEAEGPRRRRRRRRRGRGGSEAREGGVPHEDGEALPLAPEVVEGLAAEEAEVEEDEGEEPSAFARADQDQNGERRPRRRGRRGGRRRRGGQGGDEGLAASISDELGPLAEPEATEAVADFDGGSSEPAQTLVQPEPPVAEPEPQPAESLQQPEPVSVATPEEPAQENDRATRRRSTVREKVSFASHAEPAPVPEPEPTAIVTQGEPEPIPSVEPVSAEVAEPAPAATTEEAPSRKAGWWSRRFGGG